MIYIIIGIVLVLLIITYFIFCEITNHFMVKRGREVPLVDLDLSKTQYAPYEKMVREYNAFFDNIKPELVEVTANDGIKLRGFYYKNKLDTMVICFHGYRATPLNNYAVMGKILYEKGYSLLMIVERAHGESEGKYTTFADKEKYDCISWINFAKEKYNPAKIYLYGLSMGGGAILMATSLNMDKVVHGLIADSAFDASTHAIFNGMKRGLHGFAYILYPGILLTLLFKGIKPWRNKIYEVLQKNEIPVLFIHGKKDTLIPIKLGYNNYNNNLGKKEFVETEAEHVLSIYTDFDLVSNKILKFIEEN